MKKSLEQYSKEDHGIKKKDVDLNVVKISSTLINNGYQAFLVGGCIRDLLLQKKPKDFDIATDASPAEICRLFPNARIIGKRFKIVHVYTDEKKFFEVTTFRSDISKKNNEKRFKKQHGMIKRDNVYGTISQDAYRRDFTINSLYLDLDTEILHDYVGGLNDIKKRQLRLIKKPSISYQEDPVRMLRAIRFESKLDLELKGDSKESIKKMSHLINNVSPFRLFDEILKIMHSGSAVVSYKKLIKYKIFKNLFPYTDKIIKNQANYNDFFIAALTNTDNRIRDELHVNPSFIYAVFLWPFFQEMQEQYNNKKTRDVDFIFRSVMDKQAKYIAIPEFFQSTIFTIWSLQSSFLNLSSRNIQYVTNIEKFRAAFDFFYLRSLINNDLKYYADKWNEIQKNVKSTKSNRRGKTYGAKNRKQR
tara:strand:- start:340 stop:1593 length:1254 start_codon:yes stop_codon:yes gene_type:complete